MTVTPSGLLLPDMSLTEPADTWCGFLLDSARLVPTYITPRRGARPSALLLPFPAAATVAASAGQADMPTFHLASALDVLPDLVYRATRMESATAIVHNGAALAAVVPLAWADYLTEHHNTERSKQR
jgi:hypothetical protein